MSTPHEPPPILQSDRLSEIDSPNTEPKYVIKFCYKPGQSEEIKAKPPTPRRKRAKLTPPKAITDLRNCLSKSKFKDILETKEGKWRELLKLYLKDYFVSDIYNRRVENKKIL